MVLFCRQYHSDWLKEVVLSARVTFDRLYRFHTTAVMSIVRNKFEFPMFNSEIARHQCIVIWLVHGQFWRLQWWIVTYLQARGDTNVWRATFAAIPMMFTSNLAPADMQGQHPSTAVCSLQENLALHWQSMPWQVLLEWTDYIKRGRQPINGHPVSFTCQLTTGQYGRFFFGYRGKICSCIPKALKSYQINISQKLESLL